MKRIKTALTLGGLTCVLMPLSYAATETGADDVKSLEEKIAAQQKALAESQKQLVAMKAALVKAGKLKAEPEAKNTETAPAATETKKAAASVTKPEVRRWKGTNIGMGATINTGDNSSQKLNGVLNLKYTTLPWEFSGKVDPQYQHSSDQGVSTNKYNVNLGANYYFTPKNYIYNNLIYTYDKFDGNDYYWNYSAGYGRTLYQGPTVTIKGQIGPGYVQRKIQDTGEVQHLLALNTYGDLTWQVNDKTVFSQSVTPVYTTDLTTVTTSTALTTQLVGNLGLQVQFDTKYLSNTPEGSRRFTTTTSLNLLYSFA